MTHKTVIEKSKFPDMLLSHVELYVQDINQMEQFYTSYLGLIVTDRGDGPNGMVFLSRSPNEHHQIVLNPRPSYQSCASPIDHISFRVKSIAELRVFNATLQLWPDIKIQTVSHGSTWSIYFRDPEDNRFEIFTDTPWYVHQPCKFEVDLQLTDEDLAQFTLQKIKNMPGFSEEGEWQHSHQQNFRS